MEDKENNNSLAHILQQHPHAGSLASKHHSMRASRRIIRKPSKPSRRQKVVGEEQKGEPSIQVLEGQFMKTEAQNLTVQPGMFNSESTQKMESLASDPKPPFIQKIQFDLGNLPQYIHIRYENKQKLRNTDLMVEGVKFVTDPSMKSISKWHKALIVYQQPCWKQKHYHFGLLLKYEHRVLTFDGITKLWPIKQVQKSYHWSRQPDSWSCGYRVLFWVRTILGVGLDRWLTQHEGICQREGGIEVD